MRQILELIDPVDLSKPIWLTEEENDPSYTGIQATTEISRTFHLTWDKRDPDRASKASQLSYSDLYEASRSSLCLANEQPAREIDFCCEEWPRGQTIWHIVVQKRPESVHELFEWLLNNSQSDPHATDESGKPALLLAVELGFTEAVKWYAHRSDAKTLFAAARMAARSQIGGSVGCFEALLKSMPPPHKRDLLEVRKLIHAVRDGISVKSLNLKKRSLRQGIGIKQLGLNYQPSSSHEGDLRAAEALALTKMHLLSSYIQIPSS